MIDSALLQKSLEAIPRSLRRTGQDYLTQERLIRRFSIGDSTYAGRLCGYRDQYTVWTHGPSPNAWEVKCDCGNPKKTCAHRAALLLDLQQRPNIYCEAPWQLAAASPQPMSQWPFDINIDWTLIPEFIPWWRSEFDQSRLDQMRQLPQKGRHAASHMRRNPLTALWAEMHPSWLQEPEIRTTFHEWLHAMLPAEREEYPLWALLHWMQPALTLESLFLSLKPQEAIRMQAALLEQLFQPTGLIAPNARRHQALLTDLTLIDADFAQTLWHIFSNTDAMRIAHADALYLGGHTNRAISLLEQELPEEATARRQVRQRLIQWLELEPSIPHRLALAWESRSISELLPVRHLLDAAQWNAIMIATETESAAASKDDWG